MKVFGLQGNIYRLARLASRSELDEAEKARLEVLKRFVLARQKGLSAVDAARVVGRPKATIYRWMRRLKETQSVALYSRRPKRFRQGENRAELEKKIVELRTKHPTWGRRKIAKKLSKESGGNEWTVGRIISGLLRRGKIKTAKFAAQRAGQRRKPARPYAQRLKRGQRLHASTMGEAAQVDHMSVEITPGHTVKHFNGVCVASRWNVADVFSTASAQTAKKFLDKLITQWPCTLKAIQVDGGSEFMGDFESECHQRGIELFVLAPKSPKLNGRVERINGTWRADFYNQFDLPYQLDELRPYLQDFQDQYNYDRPHEGIDLQTPWQAIESFRAKTEVSSQSHMS
jgi:putative transposase